MKSVSCLALLLVTAGSAFAQSTATAPVTSTVPRASTMGTVPGSVPGSAAGTSSVITPGVTPGASSTSSDRVGSESASARDAAAGRTSHRSSAPRADVMTGPSVPAASLTLGSPAVSAPAVAAPAARSSSTAGVSMNAALINASIRRFNNLVPGGQEAIDAIAAKDGGPSTSRIDSPKGVKYLQQALTEAAADSSIARERIVASVKANVALRGFYHDDIEGARNCFGTEGNPGFGPAAQGTEIDWATTVLTNLGGVAVVDAMSDSELDAAVEAAAPVALGSLTNVSDAATQQSRDEHLKGFCKARQPRGAAATASN